MDENWLKFQQLAGRLFIILTSLVTQSKFAGEPGRNRPLDDMLPVDYGLKGSTVYRWRKRIESGIPVSDDPN